MGNIKAKTSQKACEDVKVAKVLHQLSCFCKVVEIPCNFYYASDVVISVLFVCGLFDASKQIVKVLVGNRKLF